MPNNPFNDFSSLKSLKKELEKNETMAASPKAQNEPRKKTVVHKSKDEILGDEKGRELDTVYAISCSWTPYGDGATAVTIR